MTYYAREGQKTRKSEFAVSLPKTNAGIRTIPMMDAVYDAFQEEYEYQKENGFNNTTIDGMTGFIFCNRFGNVHNPQTINRTIKRIAESYNAEELIRAKKEKRQPIILPHFSCHHLRHTFCTLFSDIIEHRMFFMVRQFVDNVVSCFSKQSLQNQCIVNISLPCMGIDKASLVYSCNCLRLSLI